MKLFLSLLILVSTLNLSAQSQVDINIMSYNLLNFPNGRNDCGTNLNVVKRYDTLRKIVSFAQPDILVACEIQTEEGADSILSRSFNVNGVNSYAMAPYHNNASGANDLQNSMYYNTSKLVLLSTDIIQTNVRDIDHYVLYVKDPNLGIHLDTVFIEMYMCHLKAGSSTADQNTRGEQALILRNYIDARPTNRHHFVCGDLNTYRSSEVCYQTLTQSGLNPLVDPINLPGSWTNNATFKAIHTQSPRTSQSLSCGSSGGMDDRFDHILATDHTMLGIDSLKYVVGSYKALGNDGNHFNLALNNGSNTFYPDSIVKAIYYMSDHLPIVMSLKYIVPTDFGLGLSYTKSGAVCEQSSNGSITVNPALGSAPYTYQWDAAAGSQTTQMATNLAAGNYCCAVTDALGKTDYICVTLEMAPAINLGVFTTQESSGCDGSAIVVVGGGVQPYSFQWNDPMNQTTQTANNLCQGTYTCTVTDANGCSESIVAVINELSITEIINGLGMKLYPNPVEKVLTITFEKTDADTYLEYLIYDLQGNLLKQGNNFLLDKSLKINTSNLQSGMYVLKIGKNGFYKNAKFIKK